MIAQCAILLDLRTVKTVEQRNAVLAGEGAPDSLQAILTPNQALALRQQLERMTDHIYGRETLTAAARD
ncbi:hypothetical protein [Rhodobacter maris]|uniref:hypothetical protein n=1 Tax=Rhodobacter maris TaxID=446682 RepID=UPI000BE28D24|nr:hypothetical protein [Rhodobacter maris]